MKVIGTGLACLDIIDQKNEILVMNGGTCANVMTVLAQLGENATILLLDYYEDIQKDFFYLAFEALSVGLRFYGNTRQDIPRIIETYDKNYNHFFYTKCPHCNRNLIKNRYISKKEANELLKEIKNNDVFFSDRISNGIKEIAKEFNRNGAKVFYEPNSGRNVKALVEMAQISNVLKFSTDRISIGLADYIIAQCQDGMLELVIATHGKDGLSFCYRNEKGLFSDWIIGPYVEFVKTRDTSGAGDWLTAGFIHYWNQRGFNLCKKTIYDALADSLKLSAIASMTEGAQGAFYNREVFDMLKREYNIKLKSVLTRYVRNSDSIKGCDVCLSDIL